MPDHIDYNDNIVENEDTVPEFQAWAAYTVAKPKEWYCWLRLILVVVVLFLLPLSTKYAAGLPRFATLFLVVGLISGARFFLDAGSIIKEHGSMSNIDLSNENDSNDPDAERKAKAMIARARATEIMGKISSSSRIWLWIIIFTVVSVYFFYAVSTYANGEGPQPQTRRPPIRLLNDFYYPGQSDVLYPTCTLGKGYEFPGRDETRMVDYNMLGALGYETQNVSDYILDKWFQEVDLFVDETSLVAQWKEDSGNTFSQVSFKLFSMPSQPKFGVVSIRGTETPADRLMNSQIYMSSVLTQVMEYLIPFGWIFAPIYPDLVAITNWIGSEQLVDSNYYSVVTDFVNDLVVGNYTYEGKTFDTLRVTGVSLGGGLAMIVGAQTGAYAVSFAGPTPVLGRKTFLPELSLEQINTRVINVDPDNDFVSSIGGEVRNTQHIICRDWPAEYTKCHSFWKQLCEFSPQLWVSGSPCCLFLQ